MMIVMTVIIIFTVTLMIITMIMKIIGITFPELNYLYNILYMKKLFNFSLSLGKRTTSYCSKLNLLSV